MSYESENYKKKRKFFVFAPSVSFPFSFFFFFYCCCCWTLYLKLYLKKNALKLGRRFFLAHFLKYFKRLVNLFFKLNVFRKFAITVISYSQ